MTTPSGTVSHAAEDWASRIAEQLPQADVVRLAAAASGGADAIHTLRSQASGPLVRDACGRILIQLSTHDPAFAAGALLGAATAVRRARQHQSIDVVWTGPESGIATSRLTAATVIGLIHESRREIPLVSYATQTEPSLNAALGEAANRGVEITLLTERHADNPAYAPSATPFPGLAATRLYWPTADRPPGASLHAKIIVVDDETALVTSANLTSRAMESNFECGVLIRGGPQPRAIRDHINALWLHGQLRRL